MNEEERLDRHPGDDPSDVLQIGKKRWLSVLVVGFVATVSWLWIGDPYETPEAPTTDHESDLFERAMGLSSLAPQWFEGFLPLDETERLHPEGLGGRHDGLVLLAPTHEIGTPRPRFQWEAVDGVFEYTIAVYAEDGERLWRRTIRDVHLDYPEEEPPLIRGESFLWEVAMNLDGKRVDAVATVAVVSEEADRILDEALGEIERRYPGDHLLKAHFAIRRNRYDVGLAMVLEGLKTGQKEDLKDESDSQILVETLQHIRLTLGAKGTLGRHESGGS